MPYVPHTCDDKQLMLKSLNLSSSEALFDEIPESLLQTPYKALPNGVNEMQMLRIAQELASKNQNGICFLGAGSYDHHIPAAVWEIASRGEFLTAYTPYQAEASQGSLQLLYEFQTMIAELTGMEVANASMYDGASALAEAILMAVRINTRSRTSRILVAGTLHPYYRETIETIVRNQHIEIITLPFDLKQGIIDPTTLDKYRGEDITALVIPQPNFFGCLELVDELTDWAQENNLISIACVNPTSLALLKPPGVWGQQGVDIVCGEGQPLGAPMASGGPYFGFFSSRMKYVRQMPGRLIGRTQDKDGNPGFTLTLQAREQHIRRAKATSNICTNQGLLVTVATIYMSLLGSKGLEQVAKACYRNTHTLCDAITQIEGVRLVFNRPFFHEALVQFERPIEEITRALAEHGFQGGYPVGNHYPELANALLICATEKRTDQELEQYTHILKSFLRGA